MHLHCFSLVLLSFLHFLIIHLIFPFSHKVDLVTLGFIADILSDRFWCSEFSFLSAVSPLGCIHSSTPVNVILPFIFMTATTNIEGDILLTLQMIPAFRSIFQEEA